MRWSCPAILFCILLLGITAAGCIDHMGTKGELISEESESISRGPCHGQDPVVGAWVYDPGGRGDAVFLYILKDSGRYDAIAIPRAGKNPLPYELWATGSWNASGEDSYNLSGRVIRHYLETGDLQTGENNETLTYDPAGDILFNRNHPAGVFTRLSCTASVPEGIDASIPFDLVAFNSSPSLSFEAGE